MMAREEPSRHFSRIGRSFAVTVTRGFLEETGHEVGQKILSNRLRAPIASWPAFPPEALATAANAFL